MYQANIKLKNKNILIYGFGISGQACFKYLRKDNKMFVYDDNYKYAPKKIKKNLLKKNKLSLYKFDYIVISPGIDKNKCSLKKYLKKNKKKIITELDIFFINHVNNQKITITGTNGKSTTSKLLYESLKKHKRIYKA